MQCLFWAQLGGLLRLVHTTLSYVTCCVCCICHGLLQATGAVLMIAAQSVSLALLRGGWGVCAFAVV